MGSAQSKNKSQIINNTVQQVIFQTIQSCKAPISQQQIISIQKSKNVFISDVNMSQYASINMQCMNTAFNSTQFNTQMQNALKQTAKSQAAALNFNSASSSNVSKTINNLTQTIQNTMSQTCAQSITQQQALIVDSSQNVVVQNVSFDQNATAYVKCLQQSQNYNNLVAELSTNIDQTASSKTTGLLDLGLDFGIPGLSGFGGSSGSSSSSILLSICCFVLLMIMGAVGGSGGKKGSKRRSSSSS